MGQVWQATDTQRNRQVALKILPDALLGDPARYTLATLVEAGPLKTNRGTPCLFASQAYW